MTFMYCDLIKMGRNKTSTICTERLTLTARDELKIIKKNISKKFCTCMHEFITLCDKYSLSILKEVLAITCTELKNTN